MWQPGIADRLVTDLPFGIRCLQGADMRHLYRQLLLQAAYFVRAGGRGVFLTTRKAVLFEVISKLSSWIHVETHESEMSGLQVWAFVLDRAG